MRISIRTIRIIVELSKITPKNPINAMNKMTEPTSIKITGTDHRHSTENQDVNFILFFYSFCSKITLKIVINFKVNENESTNTR